MKLEQKIEIAKELLKGVLKENLDSLVLYGGAARREYVEGISDINILAVVKTNPCSLCKTFWKEKKRINKLKLNIVVMTQEYINSSLDSFPLEFLDIKTNGISLYGKNPLENLEIPREPLRLQCERELKEKSMLLRKIYINSEGKKETLLFALSRAYNSLKVIARGILWLMGSKDESANPVEELCKKFELDYSIFKTSEQIKSKEIKLKKAEVQQFFERYVEEFERVQSGIDRLKC